MTFLEHMAGEQFDHEPKELSVAQIVVSTNRFKGQ